jgi:SAM-dependent methyltransferase
VWRAGQERRLEMILVAAGDRLTGRLLENGCGVGTYVKHLSPHAGVVVGLEYDLERAWQAHQAGEHILSATGEKLPFPDESFDLILSHEVLEHVGDDRAAAAEMARVLRPGGRIALFVPNRGYPFETHGVYWRGRYHFGNIPLVNYLPRRQRDRLAPHVRVYTTGDLRRLFAGLPLKAVERTIIFGAYDNIIARRPGLGQALRGFLQGLEKTPARVFGLSHFWVLEKSGDQAG